MLPSDYCFKKETVPFKVRKGWSDVGRTGEYFGYIKINRIKWAVVLFDDDENLIPQIVKAEGLLISKTTWERIE